MSGRLGRRKYATRLKSLCGRPDLTPLVDILFLAMIFFMLSSSFVRLSGIKIELPEFKGGAATDIEKFVVSAAHSENGSLIYFNDQPVSWETLALKLADVHGRSRNASIVLRVDRRVEFGIAARIIAAAERAGLSVLLVTSGASGRPTEAVFEKKK